MGGFIKHDRANSSHQWFSVRYQRPLMLVMIMLVVTLGSAGTAVALMYREHQARQAEMLAELVRQQVAIWNEVARFDRLHAPQTGQDRYEATLTQIRRAHSALPGFGETGELIVARQHGDSLHFLVPLRHAAIDTIDMDELVGEPMRRALHGEQGVASLLDYRREPVLAAYARVDSLCIGMVAKIDRQEIWAGFLTPAIEVAAVTLTLILLGILVFLRATGPMLRRMHRDRRFLQTLITNLPGVAYRCRLAPDWPMEFISQGVSRLTGHSANEFLEQKVSYGEQVIHPEDRQKVFTEIQSALDEGREFELRYRIQHKDGQQRWVWERGCGVEAAHGESLPALEGFFCDITPLKEAEDARELLTAELERRVAERTEELKEANALLEVSNKELEHFAYVASHDLRAPLRAIDNLAQWISEDLGSQADGETAENLNLMRGRVQRMSAMLDSLLQYSRVGRKETSVETVAVAKLLAELIELNPPPTGVTVQVGAGMPVLETQVVPLRHVFTNLIANAIRHHDREQGCIEVTVVEGDGYWEFSVGDDGPGIPERFQEKVFQLFQTLKPRDAGGGTGLGLALVKKYVESVGGELRLESKGRGCRFIFSWPDSQAGGAKP